MATFSDITTANSKFEEMRLRDDLSTIDESESGLDRNFPESDLSPTQGSDTSLEVLSNSSEFTFDNIIGHLEDMLIDEEFQGLQVSIWEKYWEEFEDSEENKHIYMTIFEEYKNKMEEFIVSYLKMRISGFDMDQFTSELEERKDTLEGEVFEVLSTLSDFKAFKENILDYRWVKYILYSL